MPSRDESVDGLELSGQDEPASERITEMVVGVVGLGYVGLPLAREFAKNGRVIGFDIDSGKVNSLRRTGPENLVVTDRPEDLREADFIIIAVPTPTTRSKIPDLSYIEGAGRVVSKHLKKGSIVILESTVYPGVTEDVLRPILEESGLECGSDFKIAYCPERLNPGDEDHSFRTVTKVVSGMDDRTTSAVAELYGRICGTVFKARNIKTAEAAKVIENIQRDLNIALVNEFALIFAKLGLSTQDVLDAAATKWNFVKYSPGLVGGHCIPVDPYYLVYKAEELGYHPQVIPAGRAINDYMTKHVAEIAIRTMNSVGKVINRSKVLILGLTYKENVPDTRESPARGVINELKEFGVNIVGCDPLVGVKDIEDQFDINAVLDIENIKAVDCIILTVAHNQFKTLTMEKMRQIASDNPIFVDVRGVLDPDEVKRWGFVYRTL